MEWFVFNVKLFFCKLFGREYTAKICGHKTKLIFMVEAFGVKSIYIFKKNELEYCPECFSAMSTKCSWCKEPILVGDLVTLYTPKREDFNVPEHAVIHKEDPLQLVGCLREDCADTGADVAGMWVPPGNVERTLSPYETLV